MEERRKDYPEIKDRLIRLEILQEQDIKEGNDWRIRFCNKLDKITDTIIKLPCDRREGRWLSQGVQIKWAWIAITFIMTILTGLVLMLLFKTLK